jgi:hypothetical protein
MMRPWLVVVLLLLLLPTRAWSQCGGGVVLEPYAEERLTISSTATPLTPTVYKPPQGQAAMAVLTTEQADMRYFLTQTPTPTVGHVLRAGSAFTICGPQSIQLFKAIRTAGTDVIVSVTYYRAKQP